MTVYTDISFSFDKHPLTGDLIIKKDEQAVKQSINNLVKTRAYQRGFNTDIHTGVNDLLFENMTPIIKHELKREIKSVIENFEPRVTLMSVEVFDKSHELYVTVKYKILNGSTIEKLNFVLEEIN